MIKSKVLDVLKRINEAAARSLHHQSVKLVAVSKTKPVEQIMSVYESGIKNFGQNYVDEIEEKHSKVPEDLKWHFIGHLQSNKIKKLLVPGLWMIETVDRISLADKLNTALRELKRELFVLVQVKTSEEESKSGVEIDKLQELIRHIINNCKQLKFKGLMTIGKEGDTQVFLKMLELKKTVADKFELNVDDLELSMGMSSDFEQAIQNGATSVRVGSLLFGPRETKK